MVYVLLLLLPVLLVRLCVQCTLHGVIFFFISGVLCCIARFLILLIHCMQIIWIYELLFFSRYCWCFSLSLLLVATKSFSIKCVLNYHWSHFDASCVTEWVVIFPIVPVTKRHIERREKDIARVFFLLSRFGLFFSNICITFCCVIFVYLVIFMYVYAHQNGMDMLRFYLYRLLHYFCTQILLHFYTLFGTESIWNNTNGLRFCLCVCFYVVLLLVCVLNNRQ